MERSVGCKYTGKDLKTAHIFQKDNRTTRFLKKRPHILKCQVSLCWFGFHWFVLAITASVLGSDDQFLLTSGLIKTTSTCYK